MFVDKNSTSLPNKFKILSIISIIVNTAAFFWFVLTGDKYKNGHEDISSWGVFNTLAAFPFCLFFIDIVFLKRGFSYAIQWIQFKIRCLSAIWTAICIIIHEIGLS
jgi:hypothetical protein